MFRISRTTLSLLALAGLALVATPALAGSLNPPAGPVAATVKPIAEAEPRIMLSATNTPPDANSIFHISQPGSYYLGANVLGAASKNGIENGIRATSGTRVLAEPHGSCRSCICVTSGSVSGNVIRSRHE